MTSADHEQGVHIVADEEFRAFYDCHFSAIYSYYYRRVQAADVSDHVADVFLVAFRRYHELPSTPHECTLWLFGVARRVLADQQKANFRRRRLAERIRWTGSERAARFGPDLQMSWSDVTSGARHIDEGDDIADRVMIAISRLRPDDQEVMKLNLWEQLTDAEAARVTGCSLNAFRLRLHRARKRLAANYATIEAALDAPEPLSRPPRRQGGAHA